MTDDDLLPIVLLVMKEGPGIAERGRKALRDKLAASPLPGSCAYHVSAEEFLTEHAKPKVEDLITDGKVMGDYPTSGWIAGLEMLEHQQREMARFREAIGKDPTNLQDATKKLNEARAALKSADRPESVPGWWRRWMPSARPSPQQR